jgi:hypothetical protein
MSRKFAAAFAGRQADFALVYDPSSPPKFDRARYAAVTRSPKTADISSTAFHSGARTSANRIAPP